MTGPVSTLLIALVAVFGFPVTSVHSAEPRIIEGPRNTTAIQGHKVLLHCVISLAGTSVDGFVSNTSSSPASTSTPSTNSTLNAEINETRVTWQHDGRSLHTSTEGSTWRVLANGSLLLDSVEHVDGGPYRCIARNKDGVAFSQTAHIFVHYPAKISGGRRWFNVTYGQKLLLECQARGEPAPQIIWLFNGELLKNVKPSLSHSYLSINATQDAQYACEASNRVGPNQTLVTQRKVYHVFVPIRPSTTVEGPDMVRHNKGVLVHDGDHRRKHVTSDRPEGFCSAYAGTVCSKYLGKAPHLVYYDIPADLSSVMINEQITAALWDELVRPLQQPCRNAAEVLLCHYAFPKCEWKAGTAWAKPLCREDCVAVRESFCYNEWAMIEDNKQRGIHLTNRGHFRLPYCEKLPSVHENPNGCSHAHITDFRHDEVTTTCVRGRGRFYQGKVNVTKSGITCQAWDAQEPHSHNRPPMVFPEIRNAENFCRNAGGEEPTPWCYTSDPRRRWEHCDIPLCENISSIVSIPEQTRNDVFLLPGGHPLVLTPPVIALAAAVGVGALLFIFLLCLLCKKIAFSKPRSVSSSIHNTAVYAAPNGNSVGLCSMVDIDLTKLPSNLTYHQTEAKLNPKLEKLEYPRNDIVYIRDLGQGAFGRVFQAKAPNIRKGEDFTVVAVKMLKDNASDELLQDFEREACLMAEFQHPNIVKLLGVCCIGSPMCLIFEYMERGDLKEFLRSCSPSNYIVRSGSTNVFTDSRLSFLDQLDLAAQIAAGMVYLSDMKFVHRDLATRNCLISEDMTVKISDFGLSQKIYTANYYKGSEHDAVPIRWMPLEAILYNRFTVESDIWAFGVVLWEIFSFGMQPYFGKTHEEVVRYVKEGNILSCPDGTPSSVYALMKACWNPKPNSRPNFKTIFNSVNTIRDDFLKKQGQVMM
ncbi:tyrosine-protein kinase transmembrane receptor Ror2 [Galendromus occidentalis]|uniref:receptor protein-tyrosine kinase n=1 Tax=Galendromus occidentalis TaxID=34638 RepID=A0AAJ6QPB2_9ACAR|nr:tyrosine-protein kinase transmembrane receptor Ror2 [Galendromus occidentalis]